MPPEVCVASRSGMTLLKLVRVLVVLGLASSLPSASGPLTAQDVSAPSVASQSVAEARGMQATFEAFRQSRIPPRIRPAGSRCDRQIGRICHWFGGAEEADFPPEPVETEMARRELLQSLADTWAEVKDPWLLGQLVHYLVEDRRLEQAERLARDCGLTETWWCSALLGYLLHLQEDFPGAEAAFLDALELLPEGEKERWRTPRFLLSSEGERSFRSASTQEKDVLQDRLWRFSNPLFLVEGNDRLTDHYSRLVLAGIREDSANPFQMDWGEDLEETLIRYGRTIGWSRFRAQPSGGMTPQDTRSVASHHDPASRGYLFPEEFLTAPAEVPPETWITAPREAHTWYAPPYAPDFRGLETQVARFRRGDSLLVVGAFRPDQGSLVAGAVEPVEERGDPVGRPNPFGGGGGEEAEWGDGSGGEDAGGAVQTGLFLVPEDGGEPFETHAEVREGVLTLHAPTGRYVSSLEVLDVDAGSAWRARQGVSQDELFAGLAGLSDILLLEEDAPLPADLDEAIPFARPGIHVRPDERFVVAWEVYGLEVDETARITVGFTRGRPGFMRRVGEFLGIVEPDVPVEVSFDQTAPDVVQTLFRALHLELPDLEPGEYTLHVQLDVGGREPAIASRPLVVAP